MCKITNSIDNFSTIILGFVKLNMISRFGQKCILFTEADDLHLYQDSVDVFLSYHIENPFCNKLICTNAAFQPKS